MTDVNAPLDVESLREQFLNVVFDEYTLTLEAQALADYAIACGETAAKFTNPEDPDFQAPPTIASSFQQRKRYPDGFPTARTHMHDIYTKSGRSGRMVFFVNRMEFTDPDNNLLGSADTSIVIREKPQS